MGEDIMARDLLRPNPTMEAGVMVDTMARGQPRLSLTMDGVDTEDTMAKGPLRLSPTMEATMVDIMARGLLKPCLTTDGVDTMAKGLLRLNPTMEATMEDIMAKGPPRRNPTMEAGAMAATMASDLLMPKPTTMGAMAHMLMASNCIMTLIHSKHPLVKELNRIKI